ncbi:galactose oxidase [Leucogyrophana mollusca]|uniref:Galactose oxidase n=1 Tax=Leucogyrophana mollusca TaxID=85980 RepID=A0ACB8BXZ8_9AGAM|nr:galactose oxidase [Leucogyrophana mollusca]
MFRFDGLPKQVLECDPCDIQHCSPCFPSRTGATQFSPSHNQMAYSPAHLLLANGMMISGGINLSRADEYLKRRGSDCLNASLTFISTAICIQPLQYAFISAVTSGISLVREATPPSICIRSRSPLNITRNIPRPFRRYGHTLSATTASNGRLYLFGGLVRGVAHNDLYKISLSAVLVETTGESPSPRFGHASALVGNVLIVWGGNSKSGADLNLMGQYDDDLYLLKPEWTKVYLRGPSPAGRLGHAAVITASKFYMFGGQVDGQYLDDLWVFDLRSLRLEPAWKRCEPVSIERPTRRSGHILVAYGTRFVLFGGTNGHCCYNDTWTFDVTTRKWEELQCVGCIPSPREGHAAALVGDIIYVFGRRGQDRKCMDDLAAFSVSARRWYVLRGPNMGVSPSLCSGHAVASLGNRVFITGGESSSPTLNHGKVNILDTTYIKLSDFSGMQQSAIITQHMVRRIRALERELGNTKDVLEQSLRESDRRRGEVEELKRENERLKALSLVGSTERFGVPTEHLTIRSDRDDQPVFGVDLPASSILRPDNLDRLSRAGGRAAITTH